MKHFELAKKLRLHSDHHQHAHGAVIARGNKIISTGFNQLKTHTRSNHKWRSLHAEVSALIKADPEMLYGAECYVYRQHLNGQPANSRPCQYCMAALINAGIKTIYYSINGGYAEEDIG